MNEYPDPNSPGRPLVNPNNGQSSPSKNPCSYEEQNTADSAATKQSSLSFRGFADDPENGLSWGVEGSSNLRFGGQTSGMRFSHKSFWDSTDEYGGLPAATVWGRGSPGAGKDSTCDPFLAYPLGTSFLPMSPGNKDAGELSKQVTNFVLSDPNNQDASSPSVENKIPSNSQFRPQLLISDDPSESPYPSQQETPLIQNGNVSSLSRFGHFNNIQVSMNPYGPQGPSVSLEDLERLVAQLGGVRMGGGTREQQQILPPPPQNSQLHSYTSNGFFSVAQDPRPNYVYDQHQNSSAPVTTAPDLSSSGCPNVFSAQGPPVEPSFHQQQLEVSHQQQPDPYAFAAAAAAVINGTAQPNCIPFLNQPPFAGQPGSLTMPPGTFDQGVSQNQDGFYSSTTAADRLKSLAILSNGGMNVLPLQQLRVPPVASPFMEHLSQMVQIRPVQPSTFSIPPPQQAAPTRSQIIDHQLPLQPSTFCYPDGSHPQSSQYVACPSPLNAPPLLTPLTFPHPNPNTPTHGDCYPLSSVTPDALSNAFSMGFTRFGQQSQRNRGGGRFNRPPLAMDAYGARPSTHIRGGQSFTSSSHQQQRPVYYRNQPPPPSVNFTSNGCSVGPRMPLVSNSTPIPSQVFPSQPMMPLQSHSSLGASCHQMVVPDRSRPLDDYNKYTRIEQMSLQSMSGCFVKYSKDQTGSRLIQLKLEKASAADKNIVFNEILPSCHELITDVFGNYVIQKFLDLGTPEHKLTLIKEMEGKVRELSLHVYGCRVIQKAIETFDEGIQLNIMKELKDSVLECVKDQNGNHVVQKCIERVPPQHLQFIVDAYKGNVLALSTHSYGCRVIQRILQYCTPEQVDPIFEELYACANSLFEDQYGNYVIQHILEKGTRDQKSRIIGLLKGRVVTLSMHKFASNVVEKAVSNSTTQERQELTSEVLVDNDQQHWNSTESIECKDMITATDNSVLWSMMKDQYANYVIQKMLEEADSKLRQELMKRIQPYLSSLRQFNYAKHIINKVEKYTLRTFGNSSVDNVAVMLSNADLNSDVLTSDDDEEVGTKHQELVKKDRNGNSGALKS